MMRFPHLFEQTFRKLNNKSLFRSREVARSWKFFINERNYPWLCVVNISTILQNSDTYLHLAAGTGQVDAFKTSLSEEMNRNIKNTHGQTLFHLACKNGRLNTVELLIESTNLNIDIMQEMIMATLVSFWHVKKVIQMLLKSSWINLSLLALI